VRTKKTKTKTKTEAKSYPKMPTGVQTRARAASGDDGAVFDLFDPALWGLDPTGNVLRKVAAASEGGITGTAASRADLMSLLRPAAATAEFRETVAALESQVHSDEIATHGLNATLSGKYKDIARLEVLRGANEEERWRCELIPRGGGRRSG
jgi:hypothetical protein